MLLENEIDCMTVRCVMKLSQLSTVKYKILKFILNLHTTSRYKHRVLIDAKGCYIGNTLTEIRNPLQRLKNA